MPLPGLPCVGTYKIVPVIKDEAATSINGLIEPVFQTVRLGLQDKEWEVSEESDGVYQLSIKGVFRYTGEQHEKVIASVEKSDNLLWNIGPAQTSGKFFGLIITPKGEYKRGWTIADLGDPESEIVLKKIDYSPLLIYPPIIENPAQLFRFVKVD